MKSNELNHSLMVKQISDIFRTKVNKNLKEHNITIAQLRILLELFYSSNKSATLKELERVFNHSQATIAGIADRLEKKGLVEGYTDTKDHRIKHIKLTKKGLALCEEAYSKITKEEEWLLECLTEEEKQILNRLLQKVYHHIKSI